MPKFRSKTRKGEGSDAPESVSRGQEAAAVEQADLADDGPKIEQETTEVAGTSEAGVEFAGASGAEQLSELIAQTGSDGDNSELDADEPSTTRKGRGDYDELTDEDSNSVADRIASSEDPWASRPRDVFGAGSPCTSQGGGASSTSIGGGAGGGDESSSTSTGGGSRDIGSSPPHGLESEGESDSTSSFADYVETKTGIDEGLATDQGPDRLAGRSVAGDKVVSMDPPGTRLRRVRVEDGDKVRYGVLDTETGGYLEHSVENVKNGIKVQYPGDGTEVVIDKNNGTTTVLSPDGSTVTTHTSTGKVLDTTPPLKQPGGIDGEEEVTLEQKMNDPLFREYLKSKNAGGGGDGTTDPAEHEDAVVVEGAITEEEIAAERLQQFGQPAGEDFAGGRDTSGTPTGDWNDPNFGAVDPADGYTVGGGSQRTEDPGDAATESEPVAGMPEDDTEEATPDDDGGGSYLPPPDLTLAEPPPDLDEVGVDPPS